MIETMVAQGQISVLTAARRPSAARIAGSAFGNTAYRVRASFLAGQTATVAERLREFEMHRIDLSEGAVLEKGCVYLVPLMEGLDLPPDIEAVANAKSSTGRLDLLTRTITDHGKEFDRIVEGYTGRFMLKFAPAPFRFWCDPACASIRFAFARVMRVNRSGTQRAACAHTVGLWRGCDPRRAWFFC